MKIPLSAPEITEAEIEAVVAVLRSSRLSLGPVTEKFESQVAATASVPHAIAVSSGTAGLHLCIRGLGIGEGDEVIVPSFAFIAAANAIRYERAMPVFVDIDPVTLNIDPQRIEEAITPRTRAIMAVHTFGVPAAMSAILEIAARHGLEVIEDACEAIGAEYDSRKVGSIGHAGVFAFYPNKQITTGEGGVVVTRDEAFARRVRALRNQGRYETDDWFQHSELGYNYRISEINCALGLAQMMRLEEILKKREGVACAYHERLSRCTDLVLPPAGLRGGRVSWFVYVVRVACGLDRDGILRGMTEAGIGCGRYFAPIHLQPGYSAWRNSGDLTVTEAEAQRTIALPFFNNLGSEAINEVCGTLERLL
jgi:perosamine synthetase